MKKITIIGIIVFSIISILPTYALNSKSLEKAIDRVVIQRGRENRQQTLHRLTMGVQETQLLNKSQKQIFLGVLASDMNVYHNDNVQEFLSDNLLTDTSIRSVSLEKILDGGPGKDGIPALTNPRFISYEEAKSQGTISDNGEGISVTSKNGLTSRFYPFTILNWHEIINDSIDTRDIMVTYCPLCGTAIVYNRRIGDDILEFNVSGKIYQSNLLMYDTKTESLWSQAFGKAMMGKYTDYELEYVPSQQLTASQFINIYPNGKVLSADTGYDRNYYIGSPYGEYDQNDELLFPVDEYSRQLSSKTLMVVVNDKRGFSAAFDRKKLLEVGVASIQINPNITVTAVVEEGGVVVVEDGHYIIPHFSEMWFSWSNRNQGSELWWSGD